jgi:DNA-binding transcriptional regulator PaaX
MGTLEDANKRNIRMTKIQKAILGCVAVAGVLGVAMVAPNAFQALKIFDVESKLTINTKRTLNKSRKRLVDGGLLEYTKDGYLTLTQLGRKTLQKVENSNYQITIPDKWDKKWRVLIFDIKESKKSLRDKVRNTLVSIGFVKLQNSVWVFPYDCEDLITLLKADFSIGREVLYMIVDRIENEETLLKYFGIEK